MNFRFSFWHRLVFICFLFIVIFVIPIFGDTPEPELTITFAGDIYLGGPLESLVIKNPAYPFVSIREICQPTDFFIANLEGPLSTRGEIYVEKTYTFRSDPRVIRSLTEGGLNILSLANNHIMDFGPEALIDTITLLEENNIAYAGAGANLSQARQPALVEKNNIKIAFLSYNCTYPLEFNAGTNNPGTARGIDRYILKDVRNASSIADLVIVAFHWSAELLKERKPYQSYFAKLAVDSGANLVIGHHPHVIQGVEVYKKGLIAYSLGNFVFASRSKNVQDSLILQVQLTQSGLKTATFYPININNYQVNFQPTPLSGQEALRALGELQTLSGSCGPLIEILDDRGVIVFNQ